MSKLGRWWRRATTGIPETVGPLFDGPDQAQPRFGYVDHTDGTRTPVRFLPTTDPAVFLAVELDGRPAIVQLPDVFFVDVIGPGQSVQFTVRKSNRK